MFETARDVLEQIVSSDDALGAQWHVHIEGTSADGGAVGEDGRGGRLSTEALVHWFSAGKPLTAVAVGRLLESERLGVCDRIAEHLDDDLELDPGTAELTLWHLLTHTGGIRVAPGMREGMPWDEKIRVIAKTPIEPRWRPGTDAGYHLSTSWYLLAEIVQRRWQKSLDRIVREDLCSPAAIDDIYLGMTEEELLAQRDRIVRPVQPTDNDSADAMVVLDEWRSDDAYLRCLPGGGTVATAQAMAGFYGALSEDRCGGRRLLSAPMALAMTGRHRSGVVDQTFRQVVDFGLGVVINSHHYDGWFPYGFGAAASRETFGHGGMRTGVAFADPRHRVAVSVAFIGMVDERRHQRRQRRFVEAIYSDLGVDVEED